MSRIGKQPVIIPDNVQVEITKVEIKIKGPKGELIMPLPRQVTVAVQDQEISVRPNGSAKFVHMMYGTVRSLINNMVLGVTEGFTKELALHGVGYRVAKEGNKLVLSIGYKHPVYIEVPDYVNAEVPDATHIVITGINKQQVGLYASKVRALRPPEVYKGSGIRYSDEQVRLKEIKSGAK